MQFITRNKNRYDILGISYIIKDQDFESELGNEKCINCNI